jgi:hypothetical protein
MKRGNVYLPSGVWYAAQKTMQGGLGIQDLEIKKYSTSWEMAL